MTSLKRGAIRPIHLILSLFAAICAAAPLETARDSAASSDRVASINRAAREQRSLTAIVTALENARALLDDRKPKGAWMEAQILPVDAKVDGNLAKYTHRWQEMKDVSGTIGKTEVAFAMTEENKFLRVAVRCQEANMASLRSKATCNDSDDVLQDDRVEILLTTPKRSWFRMAVTPTGIVRDESYDAELVARDGTPIQWNAGIKVHARRLADRWELEVSIPVEDFKRPGPSVDNPWGINVLRIKGSNVAALVPECNGSDLSQWRRLWRKWQDFEGRPMDMYCYVVTRHTDYPPPYTVARARGNVALSGEWDGPDWGHVKPLKLVSCMIRAGDKDVFLPDTQAKLQYDEKYLYVMFQVKDRYVLGLTENDMTDVCLDSCVEFFVRPRETPTYFNFEMSCNGKMLLYEVENLVNRKLSAATPEELRSIERFHTLPSLIKDEIQEPVTWRVCYRIPLEFFVRRSGIDTNLSGQTWTANFFKCADHSSHHHWMSWNPTNRFHNPDGFGRIVFE